MARMKKNKPRKGLYWRVIVRDMAIQQESGYFLPDGRILRTTYNSKEYSKPYLSEIAVERYVRVTKEAAVKLLMKHLEQIAKKHEAAAQEHLKTAEKLRDENNIRIKT